MWLKCYAPKAKPAESADQQIKTRRLKAELKRVIEECDIPKNCPKPPDRSHRAETSH